MQYDAASMHDMTKRTLCSQTWCEGAVSGQNQAVTIHQVSGAQCIIGGLLDGSERIHCNTVGGSFQQAQRSCYLCDIRWQQVLRLISAADQRVPTSLIMVLQLMQCPVC